MAAGAFRKMRTNGFWDKVKSIGSKVWSGVKKGAATVLDGVSQFAGGFAQKA